MQRLYYGKELDKFEVHILKVKCIWNTVDKQRMVDLSVKRQAEFRAGLAGPWRGV